MNVMFVCTGNTCRSPMAKGFFEKEADSADGHCINAESAGLSVYVSSDATEEAIAVMNEFGIDISGHRSSQITKESIIWSDLVLTMTMSHRNILIDLYPEYSNKICLLTEYAFGEEIDIFDPFGGDENDYMECARHIKEAVSKAFDRLIKTMAE